MPCWCYSSLGDRIFIDDQACRSLLSTYAKTATCNLELKNFLGSDMDQLVTMLTKHCPVLSELLLFLDKPVPCPFACAELLSALSSPSPVCALILPTPSIVCLVKSICTGMEVRSFPDKWKLLHENVPIIYNLLCYHNVTCLPQEYRSWLMKCYLRLSYHFWEMRSILSFQYQALMLMMDVATFPLFRSFAADRCTSQIRNLTTSGAQRNILVILLCYLGYLQFFVPMVRNTHIKQHVYLPMCVDSL